MHIFTMNIYSFQVVPANLTKATIRIRSLEPGYLGSPIQMCAELSAASMKTVSPMSGTLIHEYSKIKMSFLCKSFFEYTLNNHVKILIAYWLHRLSLQ